MKRFFLIIVLVFFTGWIVSAASISVTNPPSPHMNWMHSVQHPIKWQVSGSLLTNLKIDLMNSAGTNKITTLFNNVDKNLLQKNWTPPITVFDGTYRIRVSTIDGQVFGKSSQFQVVTNPNILYPANYHGSITGPAVPSRNIKKGGHIFAPGTKPKFLIIKFNNVPYSHNMTTPMCTGSQPIKIKLSAICKSTPVQYKVVINLANPTQPGRQLHHMKNTGWTTNGNFSIYIHSNDLAPIMEGAAIPTYFTGQVLIYAKAGNPEQTTSKTCEVRFTN